MLEPNLNLEPIKLAIAKLELGPGDILVVKISREVSSRLNFDIIDRAMRGVLHGKNQYVLIDDNVELSVLSKTDIESRARDSSDVNPKQAS